MSHFYEKLPDGTVEPRHVVPMSSDPTRTRGTRITDVRKWRKSGRIIESSVTTVMGILNKEGLNSWKVDQHIQTCFEILMNEGVQSTDYEGFLRKVKADTQERLDIAPQKGTDIHAVLESYMAGVIPIDETEKLICENVSKLLPEGCKWSTEAYFLDSELGYAGCADLISQSGKWVIDYKSKQTKEQFDKVKIYPEHSRQLAAYGRAFFGNEAFRAANIFVCLESGEASFHEHSQASIMGGWLDFLSCLDIYKRNLGE